MESPAEWWSAGDRLSLDVGGTARSIFVRRMGSGPSLTLLHGFPSSSHDWALVAPPLASDHALLLPDFLGFGASDKPAGHEYSLTEQADLVEALWDHEGITETVVVAHDYAVSVTQELLARRSAGALTVDLLGVHLLNGGLYPDLHRPEPIQTALLDPDLGPQISADLAEDMLAGALAPTFAEGFDLTADSAAIWAGLSRNDGHRQLHLLIRYILDRRQHERRWVDALEHTDVPLAFVWGMLDPISGAHMAERIRERLPDAPFVALEDVGHWPPREAPDRTVAAIRAVLGP